MTTEAGTVPKTGVLDRVVDADHGVAHVEDLLVAASVLPVPAARVDGAGNRASRW